MTSMPGSPRTTYRAAENAAGSPSAAAKILAKEKVSMNYVVIELKKNQTSDDTVGQLTRYMGWIKRHKGNDGVKGIIIAGQYDTRLEYALAMVPNTEVFIYEVDFRLKKETKVNE